MNHQTIIVLDFGGQYNQLIARRVRECGVYCEVKPYTTPLADLLAMNPIGFIFTGGPNSVYLDNSPKCADYVFDFGAPILGICYGMQYVAHRFGGIVKEGSVREYGQTLVHIGDSVIFNGLDKDENMLMSHTDYVAKVPDGFKVIATTDNCPCAAFENADKTVFGVQFHPEVERSTHGEKVLENFVINVCGAKRDYSLDDYIDTQIKAIREQVGDKRVLLGLSGGVDSSVVAALISKAIPDQLLCVYVDHGFMRKYETEQIKDAFKDMPLTLEVVDAGEHFLSKLKGVVEPEQKRKIIGAEFVKTFADVATAHKGYDFLAQGTIYPDVIESGANNSANIKSHHNVGGLPKDMPFIGLVEPLRGLFKDEVRIIGKKLGLPDTLVNRQPFPGPGLAIRTIGEITKDKLEILRDADAILRAEILASGIKTDQYFAVITDTKSVGVIGDYRNYGYVIALRAVTTSDFMTAEYTRIPYDLLTKISSRIVNEVKGVSRVVYDVTGKPPATIEWE